MSLTVDTKAPSPAGGQWVRVATLAELQAAGHLTVVAEPHVVALFAYNGRVYAVDNRCPHMGSPWTKAPSTTAS